MVHTLTSMLPTTFHAYVFQLVVYIAFLETTFSPSLKVFPIDEVSVIVSGRESDKVRFVAPVTNGCPPGKSTYTLFCSVCATFWMLSNLFSWNMKTPASGTFLLESSEVRCAHLLLQTNYRKAAGKGPAAPSPFLIRIPTDPFALDIRISQSNKSEACSDHRWYSFSLILQSSSEDRKH